MILWLSVIGAVVVAGIAGARMWRRHLPARDRSPRDTDWGDWPPDQMAR